MPYFQSLKLIHKFIFLSPTRSPKLRGVITRNACYKRMECQGRRSCQGWTSAAATLPSPPSLEDPAYEAVSIFPISRGSSHTGADDNLSLSRQGNHKGQNYKIIFTLPRPTGACQDGFSQIHLLPLLSSADLSDSIRFLNNSREMQICDLKIQPQSHHSPPSSYPAPSPKED